MSIERITDPVDDSETLITAIEPTDGKGCSLTDEQLDAKWPLKTFENNVLKFPPAANEIQTDQAPCEIETIASEIGLSCRQECMEEGECPLLNYEQLFPPIMKRNSVVLKAPSKDILKLIQEASSF